MKLEFGYGNGIQSVEVPEKDLCVCTIRPRIFQPPSCVFGKQLHPSATYTSAAGRASAPRIRTVLTTVNESIVSSDLP